MVRQICLFLLGISCAFAGAVAGAATGLDADESPAEALAGPRLLGNLRLRYEFADDELAPQDATAVTVRYRGAVEAPLLPRVTFLGEVEASQELVDDFNDGRENWSMRLDRPVIVDPDSLELNRLQLLFNLAPGKDLIAGRQRIVLDDERFFGVSAFRQNDRTFDALRFSADLGASTLLDAGYLYRTHRVLGSDSPFGVFRGHSFFVNLNLPTPAGRLSLFHYALDLETGPEKERLDTASSQTTGVRLSGRHHGGRLGVLWEASYALQSDYADNPIAYDAYYALASLTVTHDRWSLAGRAEVLSGSDEGQGFQTPLATLRKFQGDADVFFLTPAQGVEDLSVSGEWRFDDRKRLSDIKFFARHHWFGAEQGGADYGTELDFGLSARVNRTSFSASVARYDARSYASDLTRVFLGVSQIF